jgi:uncharacterized membrane protein
MNIDIRHRTTESGWDPAATLAVIVAALVTFWVLAVCAAIMHDKTVHVVIEFKTHPVTVMTQDGGAGR